MKKDQNKQTKKSETKNNRTNIKTYLANLLGYIFKIKNIFFFKKKKYWKKLNQNTELNQEINKKKEKTWKNKNVKRN